MIYQELNGKKRPAAKKAGKFILGDPAKGANKHKVENEVLEPSEDEAARLIEYKRYSIRVETDTRPSLVRRNLFRDGRRLT